MIPAISNVAPAPDSGQEFARYEFKFVLNARKREALEEAVANFMTCDAYVHPELDNAYLVRSLYFENRAAANYYEKIDGIRFRQKFRLRTYGDVFSPDLPIFLEEKGRYVERTYKRRIPIRPEDLPSFSSSSPQFSLLGRYADTNLVEKFMFAVNRKVLRPTVLVDYVRRPYVSDYDFNFRVTFDDRVRATAADSLFPGPSQNWRMCDAGYTIVEVKFHRRVPAWFHRILQTFDLQRISISKFCRGMEVCDLAKDLS